MKMSEETTKYREAKRKVARLRGFYTHLAVYLAVNTLLFLIDTIASPDTLWFFWPLMGWGLGIALHAILVFSNAGRLGAEWEERKIREIMDNE
jgi:hypothetical protein